MRYVVMHKIDPSEDQHAPPSQKLIEEMGGLIEGSVKSGIFVDGDGLQPPETRVRVRASAGQLRLERGPYEGQNELPQRLAQIRVADLDAAIAVAGRYAEALGDLEIEIGPVVEAWDLGFLPKPSGLTSYRFLLLWKSDARSEAGEPLPVSRSAALEALENELRESKVLRSTVSLAPSARSRRLRAGQKGQRTWTDGPFAETKELVSGFSVLEQPDRESAEEWANRYAEILGLGTEVDLREVES